ncbi:tyrosine-type recombinase/integrase [Salmonella enterica]|nr:tyrosine-type recombinase/integrase [Salmonella enterica]EJX3319265.1 tyrosine-type recombinase/integrase [Salmonella enterica]ELG7087707.1 tyrosine-type recombinase/integrase [Salmonella enterica]ELL0619328.1 tyrosine-type recombinase/integrase [Salmonella enterica]ELL0633020.1 tyrosine-type recombinase/integrase [Salmonella enterica]
MAIRKLDDGRYELDTRTGGRGSKRVRRLFQRKSDAVAFERYMLGKIERKEWDSRPQRDKRPLSEILDRWWLYHGQSLKNGEIEKRQLAGTIAAMGDPSVCELDKRILAHYRIARANRGIKASTINRELYRLSGMFSALIKIGEFSGENPAHGLPPLAESNPETVYLTTDESAALLYSLEDDYRRVALLCLSTGARWGEASTLKASQVMHGRVTFLETKNGKKRTVPISPDVEEAIKTRESGHLFDVDYKTFRQKLRRIKPDLPDGQATHVLRHTFATHFMMNGGNIITLQRILGHATIQQTMTYAHFAPDYLADAMKFNPVAGFPLVSI